MAIDTQESPQPPASAALDGSGLTTRRGMLGRPVTPLPESWMARQASEDQARRNRRTLISALTAIPIIAAFAAALRHEAKPTQKQLEDLAKLTEAESSHKLLKWVVSDGDEALKTIGAAGRTQPVAPADPAENSKTAIVRFKSGTVLEGLDAIGVDPTDPSKRDTDAWILAKNPNNPNKPVYVAKTNLRPVTEQQPASTAAPAEVPTPAALPAAAPSNNNLPLSK